MSTEQKKRGRKSKKEEPASVPCTPLQVLEPVLEPVPVVPVIPVIPVSVPVLEADDSIQLQVIDNIPLVLNEATNETNEHDAVTNAIIEEPEKQCAKKRGRKPKGGKIIQQAAPVLNANDNKPNVILHLKCFLRDLQQNTMLQNVVDNYTFSSNKNELSYEIIQSAASTNQEQINNNHMNHLNHNHNHNHNNMQCQQNCDTSEEDTETEYQSKKSAHDMREVWKKLKALEQNLHMNNIADKKSACFWCTCEFDNPPVYIPKYYLKDSYHVYGCFCSPECAAAHLMDENIDSSARFERYHLMNHIYTKIYDYKKNIKPAPNPYYMLDKYYGNLSIQEYRALLRNERLFLIVDKPLTRILPELHEDNDDFIINNKIIPSNTYQIKKKLQRKQQTKTTIMNENFGMVASSGA
jgi:hypothetical protein